MKPSRPSKNRLSALALGLAGALAMSACGKEEAPPPPTPVTPIAFNQAATVNEGSTLGLTLTGEAGPDEALTFTIVEAPQHGTLEGTAPNLTYVPNTHFLGADRFTFTVGAGDRTSAQAVFEVAVLNAPFFTISRGSNAVTSKLYFTDGRGATSLVGDTGHSLIAIKADPTNGTLYAATRQEDFEALCDNCLVTLDRTTGAATVVGTLDHDGSAATRDGPVASLAFKSDGTLFGFSEKSDDAVSIDKATGAVTVLGDSELSTSGHGMWTTPDDNLWFINGGGAVYTIDATTGAATLIHAEEVLAESTGSANDFVVRGDRNPLTGTYWGVSPGDGDIVVSGIARVAISAESASYVDSPRVELIPAAHNLAFAR